VSEKNPDGSDILRHTRHARGFVPAEEDHTLAVAVEAFMEERLGPASSVWHEVASNLVHIDVHIVAPRSDRPMWVLFTTGMSGRPMTPPPGSTSELPRRAELVMGLPQDWFDAGAIASGKLLGTDPRHWPVKVLKYFARFPHEYQTWLGVGHTIPNGDPPEPWAEGTALTGAVLMPPIGVVHPWTVHVSDGREIALLSPVLLDTAEMDFKLTHGFDALVSLLERDSVDAVLSPSRRSMVSRVDGARKPWWKLW
jgi:hypothetical protein